MIKSELVQRVARQNPHLYSRDIENVVNAVLDGITGALARGDRVELRGFGAFSIKRRSARLGRNPRTGSEVHVAAKAAASFKTGKDARTPQSQRGLGLQKTCVRGLAAATFAEP